jgi:hypothetical protein
MIEALSNPFLIWIFRQGKSESLGMRTRDPVAVQSSGRVSISLAPYEQGNESARRTMPPIIH